VTDDGFEAVLEHVEAELGFATSHYNDSYLDRRISARMRRTGAGSYREYLGLLEEDSGEPQALLDSMSINVTGFFRNPEVWEMVGEVLAELSAEDGPIRIWSAACADGREPYSLSMLAHADDRIDEDRVEILATDIHEGAIETARRGVYETSRTVDVGEQLAFLDDPDRHVERSGDRFRVRAHVRRPVDFERHDLINDPPKSGIDVVVCRNLFIYIDSAYKESIVGTISTALRPGGHLVIGKAETIPPALAPAFDVRESRLRIYRLADPELIPAD